ncbi:hypothetical protein BH10BAC3_BH10BAC3_32070 [soil metagenome]
MKRFFTPLMALCLFAFSRSNAAIVTITVMNFQFNPANTNVTVGDVVRFHFASGFHSATSSGASIPAGATPINSGDASSVVRDYDYPVSVIGTYNYYCIVHGDAQGNGMIGTFTVSEPLPVTLNAFAIASAGNKMPVINWSTATEQNVNYFSVRSSTDGINFFEITKVIAKGNSNTILQYSFTDNNASSKHRYIYYELVTIDKDGKESYSSIKIFKTSFASTKLVMQLGPNPIKRPGQLMVKFNAEKSGTMLVNVFDAGGKKAMSLNMTAFPGLNNGHLHVCDLAPGIYTLQFNYEGLRETKKIVVN